MNKHITLSFALVLGLMTGNAYAQFGEGTDNLTDLQTEEETTQPKAKPVQKRKSPPTKTKPKKRTNIQSGALLLSDAFYEAENNHIPFDDYEAFQAYRDANLRVENSDLVSTRNIHSEIRANGGFLEFYEISEFSLDDGTPLSSVGFRINVTSSVHARTLVAFHKDHKLTWIVPDTKGDIQMHHVMVVVEDEKAMYFLPSLMTRMDSILYANTENHDVPPMEKIGTTSFWKTTYAKNLSASYFKYLKEASEFYDDEFDVPTHREGDDQSDAYYAYATKHLASAEIFEECTTQAYDQSSWYEIDLDESIYGKVTVSCFQRTLWNEYMYNLFRNQKSLSVDSSSNSYITR